MKLTNSAQMREIDRYVISNTGVSGAVLMANAARCLAEAALEHLSVEDCTAVFCGAGNNGGDGIGAAAYLMSKGVPVRVFLIGDTAKLTSDSLEMLQHLRSIGGSLEPFIESVDLVNYVNTCGVVIDAIFGIGLNSELRGDALLAVEMINASPAFKISADIASGVAADTGAVLGNAICADMTITFSIAKPGHFIEPGCLNRGELRICDIGIPQDLLDGAVSRVFAVINNEISLPRRKPDTHKYNYGRCFIAAGSVAYTGAPVLSSRAALRMGAGLVSLGVPESAFSAIASKCLEETPFPLPCDNEGRLSAKAAGELLRRAANSDVCLIGPGLGTSSDITEIILSLLKLVSTPLVLDADALTALAGKTDALKSAVGPVILTPHMGEFARLGGEVLSGDKLSAARVFASQYNCTLVLKGHRTITAMPDGTAYINTTGGPAMAKGGSGDVLAGMIAALLGQRFPIKEAVTTAVYLHGLAGDMCASEYGEYSVVAGDIIDMLPKAVKSVIEVSVETSITKR